MIASRSAKTVAPECVLVGCGRYSVFNINRISDEILGRFERNWCVQQLYIREHTVQITCFFDEISTSGPQDTYEDNACDYFSFSFLFSHFFTNNPNLENPSSDITRPKKTKPKKNYIAIIVVYVCGTGCQNFEENDHKLGCATSVEHTPHPLGRPSSYHGIGCTKNIYCRIKNTVLMTIWPKETPVIHVYIVYIYKEYSRSRSTRHFLNK